MIPPDKSRDPRLAHSCIDYEINYYVNYFCNEVFLHFNQTCTYHLLKARFYTPYIFLIYFYQWRFCWEQYRHKTQCLFGIEDFWKIAVISLITRRENTNKKIAHGYIRGLTRYMYLQYFLEWKIYLRKGKCSHHQMQYTLKAWTFTVRPVFVLTLHQGCCCCFCQRNKNVYELGTCKWY
jgi:hypothetical protein